MPRSAKPSKIIVDLKLIRAEWDLSDKEADVLQKFLNELRSRRAFEVNRGMALEEPILFLASVTEFRSRLRAIANELPVSSSQARVAVLTAIEWAGEILDAWHLALHEVAPNTWEFSRLELRDMMKVMETVWPMVETVRSLLTKLATDLERQLSRK